MEEVCENRDNQIGICKISTDTCTDIYNFLYTVCHHFNGCTVKEEHGFYHIGNSDSRTADITEFTDSVSEFCQFYL